MGVDPATGQQRPIQLDYDKLRGLTRRGLGKVKEAAFLVPEVLARPSAVFRGLTRDTDEPLRGTGWLCYVGRPHECYEDDGRKLPRQPNRVFLVFVNDDWVAYNWYWYAADANQPDLPESHADRFRERLI